MEEQPQQPDPSIETWEEACVISQEWAYDARLAAQRKRDRRALVTMILVFAFLAIVLSLVIIFTNYQL
jgi:predicted nucleic acid-binding Zn ribbon protein